MGSATRSQHRAGYTVTSTTSAVTQALEHTPVDSRVLAQNSHRLRTNLELQAQVQPVGRSPLPAFLQPTPPAPATSLAARQGLGANLVFQSASITEPVLLAFLELLSKITVPRMPVFSARKSDALSQAVRTHIKNCQNQ